jgi:glycosyltransferase involved in cell wall biosynthesis
MSGPPLLEAIVLPHPDAMAGDEQSFSRTLASLRGVADRVKALSSTDPLPTGSAIGGSIQWVATAAPLRTAVELVAVSTAARVLLLHSGEEVSPTLARALRGALADPEGFELSFAVEFAGRWLRRGGAAPPPQLRLVRGGAALRVDEAAGVVSLPNGTAARLRGDLRLRQPRRVEALVGQLNRSSSAEAEHGPGPHRMVEFARCLLAQGALCDGIGGWRWAAFASSWATVRRLKHRERRRGGASIEPIGPVPAATRDLPVTVIVPVRNEARNLPTCLTRLGRFERVLVVDSGSDDGTIEIARDCGAEVIDFRWNGRFPKKRNWTLRTVEISSPWVLFLDADEQVTPAFCDELAATLPGSSHAGFWLRFRNRFMGGTLRHGEAMRKLALIRRGAGEYERIDEERWSHLDMEVHEHPVVDGSIGEIAAPIGHDDYKGLEAYIAKHNEYASWEAHRARRLLSMALGANHLTVRQRFKYRVLRAWWLAPLHFLYAYLWRRGFLDGAAGLAFATLKRMYFAQIRLKMLELDAAAPQTDDAGGSTGVGAAR